MHRSRDMAQWLQTNSRTDSHSIFKLGGGIDHVTRHVWPLTKVRRSKVNVTRSR